MIYVSCRYTTPDNLFVEGMDEFGNIEVVPSDFTIFREPDHGPIGFVNNGGVIAAYVEPEPEATPPHLNHGGLVRFSGAAPTTVLEAIRMVGVTRPTKGRFRALNETLMATDQYSALVSVMHSTPCLWRITARTEAYVEVRVTDLAGIAIDPTEITIKTERVIYS